MKITDEGLGRKLGLGLRIEASTYSSIVALLETMLILVLLTTWVSSLDNFILIVILMDTLTNVANAPSG